MYRPSSAWSWTYIGIAIVQTLIVLGFESYVFAKFEEDLTPQGNDTTSQAKTIPTFLALYIFGFVYQLVLVWDGLRLKNTIQIYGMVLMNVGFVIYGAIQMEQIKQAILTLTGPDANDDPLEVWNDTKGFLIAIPCVTALGTCLLAVAAWKLGDEFAWTIYKHISADLRMKKRYLTYQVYIALLKFDFFFFLGFTIQFVVIITGGRTKTEFALTIAAIPVTILILLMAAFWTRRENLAGMISIIFLYFCGLAYFIFKMVRMYSPTHEGFYMSARKELTAFAVLTILLIAMTIVNACMCAANFNKGLKPYISRRKLESEEEKGRYGDTTELGPGPGAKLGAAQDRMTID